MIRLVQFSIVVGTACLYGWWQVGARPQETRAGVGDYVGDASCAKCHAQIAASQQNTAMANALHPANRSDILRSHAPMAVRREGFTYRVERRGAQDFYVVSDGREVIAEPIEWSFGHGEGGQTYVFRHQGQLYESRVSYYRKIDGLDVTIGAPSARPVNIREAVGRAMDETDARNCFGCHATGHITASDKEALHPERLAPGVRCEACHGPGAQHVAAMRDARETSASHMPSLRQLNSEEMSNLCGKCHRTWEQVSLMRVGGINSLRFQPYRLTNSRCYDAEDQRISCVACHDPHAAVERKQNFYDAKCLACHQAVDRVGARLAQGAPPRHARACAGKQQQNCASCHMPKYDLPSTHLTFTDHHIRVARAGEPIPN